MSSASISVSSRISTPRSTATVAVGVAARRRLGRRRHLDLQALERPVAAAHHVDRHGRAAG